MSKIIFLFLVIIVLFLPSIVSAQGLSGPILTCGTKASGKECGLCDIFKIVQNVFNFASGAALIIAPLFLIAGGVIILTSGINPRQIEKGKSIISYTVIGLVIALLSWVIVNTTLNMVAGTTGDSAKPGGFPWAWNQIQCTGGEIAVEKPCTSDEDCPTGMYCDFDGTKKCVSAVNLTCAFDEECPIGYYCGDAGKCVKEGEIIDQGWCNRPDPYNSSNWRLSSFIQNSKQKGDASADLANFLSCMFTFIPNPNLAITAISSNSLCNNPTCDTSAPGTTCGHTGNSCHYGGTNCTGYSYAVDFNLSNLTGITASEFCRQIATQAKSCDSGAWINYETNHIHVSIKNTVCGCAEGGSGTSCP